MQTKHHISVLDFLRAIAILYVILFHVFFFSRAAYAELGIFVSFIENIPAGLQWLTRGDLGVDIFFVLSAFLLSNQFFSYLKQKEYEQKNMIKSHRLLI